ncbi:thioredoxin [Herbaspirillum rubrisubalbicans]|jgi:thioredoxin 1|uniref:Thioredoxin n=2 Tax=Herbaspirillum rubrisubalbicans TaxID=80842 RepID=A0ABX9BZP5_9BURK|nr:MULTISPECIES: thioredoxin [Herbaspirillum]MCP1574840.1 thioredoxin 1 [Herbaspirillum rubrisubalbicans]QJQ03311.1 thioredoxin [Herbaspirillum rubrisubalbicans Os34]RAM63542.1 thioredoxin [Herbaspirillum rubrisubalbicans]RAN48668.1 thioredoxin [Herbaspirillum rubrisubalbicans]
MSSNIVTVTDASFEAEVLQSSQAVLVDFWAPWCMPCKMLAPLLADLADEFSDTLRIAKINADENKQSMEKYGVRGLPSMLLFIGGVERARLIGMQSKTRLVAFIEDQLEL